jgi:hypothetical protein
MNIDLNSSSSGTIHSNMVSLKSIDSSTTIRAGSFSILSSSLSFVSSVASTLMKSLSQSSSNILFTFDRSFCPSSHFQKIFTSIVLVLSE